MTAVQSPLQADQMERIRLTMGAGVRAPVDAPYGVEGTELTVADLVTGYGLAQSIIRFYEMRGASVAGKRVLVEGFGAVGAPCALYLAREGARIVGVSDREKCMVAPAGLGAAEVEALLRGRGDDKLIPGHPACVRMDGSTAFDGVGAEVFVAAAASETLDEAALERLAEQGVETIAGGANQPFREAELGATAVTRVADARFAVIPDVIANCGMARAFSYLMCEADTPEAAPVFQAVDHTITESLREVMRRAGGRPTGLLAATLDHAMDLVSLP